MTSKTIILSIVILLSSTLEAVCEEDHPFKIRGFCIAAPNPDGVERFVKFIEDELAPREVNTLILRIDFRYEYTSRPELIDNNALSEKDIAPIVEACKKKNINVIPQVNLLGHQSWHSNLGKLLEVYPEFDETPGVKLPDNYEWPNDDGLYCKSYCPLHPGVHNVIFDVVDEICDAFDAVAFHAGMDEVFYIGHEHCPRCAGKDKSVLFAGEVNKIRDHLAGNNRELWIWGDRLIDGETTGMGMWSASLNDTHRAIDMIRKDVFICDWQYTRADPTPVYFSIKGFRVAACPFKKVSTGINHAENMITYYEHSKREMKDRYQGIIQTVWSGNAAFLDEFYSENYDPDNSETACFKATFKFISEQL